MIPSNLRSNFQTIVQHVSRHGNLPTVRTECALLSAPCLRSACRAVHALPRSACPTRSSGLPLLLVCDQADHHRMRQKSAAPSHAPTTHLSQRIMTLSICGRKSFATWRDSLLRGEAYTFAGDETIRNVSKMCQT